MKRQLISYNKVYFTPSQEFDYVKNKLKHKILTCPSFLLISP